MSSQLDQDEYMLNRGYQDSARLVLQHWLWLHRLGYILHPSILINARNLKIAGFWDWQRRMDRGTSSSSASHCPSGRF